MSTAVVPRTVPTALLVGLGAVVFLANAGLLVLQLLAGRFLAPFIGSSVETWTCVIGVFLTGIALGNHFGGRIADRSASTRTLGFLLLFGAISSLSFILWWVVCHNSGFDRALPLGPRIPILAILFCLPPAFVLSLLTPLTIKLMLPDVSQAGVIAGFVFAMGTLGCLLGNYVTGFWLMAEYTLNAITIGVAIGLVILALPMFAVNYHVATTAAPKIESSKAIVPKNDPMGFQRDIRRAFLVVFLASFCGMSLELAGFRVLAPILGVSLFTWTGIIGVMLAGTACGNYLGGVLADRGPQAALQRIALLFATAIGFASAPALVRSLSLQEWPNEGSAGAWVCRSAGAVIACAVTVLAIRKAGTRRGKIVNLFAIGAVLGFALAHPIIRSLGSIVNAEDIGDRFANINASLHFDFGSLVIHLLGAAIGGAISLGLGYDPPREVKPTGQTPVLAVCLFCAALFTGLVVLMSMFFQNPQVGIYERLTGEDIVWNVLTWTFIIFFLPMFCLGMISPQVIRLSIPDTAHAGRVSGSIYAWSTVGAIVGTFVTGYFLIDWLGMARVFFVLSLVLMALAFVLGKLWKNTPMLFVGSMVFFAGVVGLTVIGAWTGRYTMESKYYAIKVYPTIFDPYGEKIPAIALDLDHLTHSYVKPDFDPTWLGYKHEEVQGELTRYVQSRRPPNDAANVLIIGGGGYTFPRWLEYKLPDVGVEVVEIDPAVTEVAHREMGLSRTTKIKSYNMDGRQFIREKARKGHYQLVIQDAVNDLSVPYHLMTKEYNDAVKQTLAPGGAYLLTLIDSIEYGDLWRAAVHTMRESFPNVILLDHTGFESPKGRTVFIVCGSEEPLDVADIRAVAEEAYLRQGNERPAFTHQLKPELLEHHLAGKRKIVLTDQYAPVDNLMSGVFRKQAEEAKKR